MTSARNIVIQSVLKPATVYVEYADTSDLKTYTTYEDLFHILAPIEISKETRIFVNRGPGSYTGIRTALTYLLGLVHGGIITDEQIVPYTSFDLTKVISGSSQPVFIKSWPRLANGTLVGAKGYFLKNDITPIFVEYETIQTEEELTIYTEEVELTDKLPNHFTHLSSARISTGEALKKLISAKLEKQPLDPLYINPVNAIAK